MIVKNVFWPPVVDVKAIDSKMGTEHGVNVNSSISAPEK